MNSPSDRTSPPVASADDAASFGRAPSSECAPSLEKTPPAPTLELAATLFTLEQLRAAVPDAVQLALAGRSNVGKSSLINALARRRQLAKISATPGKTRSVNLFRALPDGFYLTDLPGYGYARRGKEERRAWGTLIETYLRETKRLRAVVLLLDCRLPPQAADRAMVDFARVHRLSLLPVLTKADKCNQRERSARQKEWAPMLGGASALPVSARTGLGLPALWALLREAACSAPPEMPSPEPPSPAAR
ncbi:MAG TPA: ribosome biogenesis GTP-binding protein YihA/YsxC [Candidatus Mailhella merdigallinarum]|uniref:Probable GTP-binding protein EngB n=1 Tax=Candidatus Mailhella merdigallinarum TaxID=2838658 RepID=A0A9D2KNF0_9BACT|nr:ribosome biogenesis GTP-binding protein YihA/YsxC [Desulfovibrionaceae bacterium]PWM71076.1 MAG: YihA family ribosome biogenesis GTP-binding protein [Desulfovibrionaceae bacterium]HJA09528.1 ribosome biogenesis GTP-binding protein YihA/YsxC [Candidatus Mailhella merdigallinarum]